MKTMAAKKEGEWARRQIVDRAATAKKKER
jgi:hypothetical protein